METDNGIVVAATGQRLIFRASDAEAVVFESFLPAQQSGLTLAGAVGQEQRFEVLRGTVGFCIDGLETLLTAGGRLSVPRGTRCSYWNPTDEPAHLVAEVRPALDFEWYAREHASPKVQAETGRSDGKKQPAPAETGA